jgi:hypothetical protein
MSRFVKKLLRLRQTEPQPMGFATSQKAPEKPRLQIVASVTSAGAENASAALDSADAILVEVNNEDDLAAVEKICKAKEAVPAGGWLKTPDIKLLPKVMDSSCDFVIFPSETPVAISQKEKIGRTLQLDESLTEGLLRTVNDLPIDMVLVSDKGTQGPLTMARLMAIRRIVLMLNKPVIVPVSIDISSHDLQSLWDLGISSILIESVDQGSADKLAELRKTIGNLAMPVSKKKDRMSPILPHLQPEAHGHHEEEEEEEEDDE